MRQQFDLNFFTGFSLLHAKKITLAGRCFHDSILLGAPFSTLFGVTVYEWSKNIVKTKEHVNMNAPFEIILTQCDG